MKHWLHRAVAATLALVLLSGCIASQTETKINADGSGTNTIKFGIEAQYIGMLSGLGGDSGSEDPFQSAKDDAAEFPAEWEAKTSDWKEKLDGRDFQGVQIDMKFTNLAMLNDQLAKIAEQTSSDNPAGGSLTGLKVEEINNEFVVTGTANATDLAAEGDAAAMGGMEELAKAVIVWRVTMPGAVKEALPAEITTKDGNTVTWKIPADKTATYDLRIVAGKTGGSSGGSLPLILGLVGGLILLGGLGFFFMNRRKAAPAAAPAYGQPGAYDPNAGYGQPGGYQQPGQPGGYQQPGQPGQPGTYDPNDPNRR